MMSECQKVYDTLEEMNIAYEVIDHPPVFTIGEADEVVKGVDAFHAKTLFMRSKKSKNYYLVIMEGKKRLNIKALEGILDEKDLHFCSPDRLMEKLKLTPGTVSLFGLLNNEERDIKVCLDADGMQDKPVMFHPNDNTKTLLISVADVYQFLDTMSYGYQVAKL